MYILVHCLIANFGSSQNIAPAITTAIRGGMNVEFAKCKHRSLYAVSQLRFRNGAMQQLPKLTLCSVVAF